MKIASWNVNSIRSRITNVLDWVSREKPDIFCIQETKVVNESFPKDVFEDIGYNFVINGQKSYNGVATFSKFIIEEKIIGLPGSVSYTHLTLPTIYSV